MREKTPNGRLAALMREAGMTNKGLAARLRRLSSTDGGEPIAPSHTNVEKWLSGATRKPKERACQLIARALGEKLGRQVSLDEIGYGSTETTTAKVSAEYPAELSEAATALGELAQQEQQQTEQVAKLEVVPEAWGDLLVRWLIDGDSAQEKEPVAPRPVTDIDVQAVHDATRMFGNFDYRYGGGRPKPLVATYLEKEVFPLLPQVSPRDPVGREYFREVAALARLAGWTAYDTGSHWFAQRYLTYAFRFALAAGDKPLCGRILAGMSHQANFLGYYQRAVDLARAAHSGAKGHATPTTMALFSAMEARALSSLGDEAGTTAALQTAENYHGQGARENDPEWIHYFDAAELHAEFAHCFRDLGKSDLATHHAATSIAESDSIYVRSLSFCRTVFATGHLQAGELDQAVHTAKEVVDTAAQLRSYRVVFYLDDFRNRLGSYADAAAVREFNEYAEEKMPSERAPMTGRLVIP